MPRLSLVAVLVCAAGLMAACQPSPSGKAALATPDVVTGGEIEVTALDAPPGAAVAEPASAGAKPAGTETAAAQPMPAAPEAEATAEPVAAASAEPAPTPDMAETPETPKSERQLACEKKKGRWSKIGKGDARACVYMTKDAGKRCERESQCESTCLARSGTCAPFKPLYGCNEILQDNGVRVTLCLD